MVNTGRLVYPVLEYWTIRKRKRRKLEGLVWTSFPENYDKVLGKEIDKKKKSGKIY